MNFNELHTKACQNGGEDEKELIRKISVIFRHFAGLKITNRLDAEEVVQNALVVLARKYKNIDVRVSFASWAHQVLKNEIMKYYRQKGSLKETRTEYGDHFETVPSVDPNPELKKALLDCLRQLCRVNSRYARSLNLKYLGFRSGEICRKLKVTRNNFHVILFRARSMLKQCLEERELE